jgi:hypothetical protein
MVRLLIFLLSLMSMTLYASDDVTQLEPEETLSEEISSSGWKYYRVELDEPANLTVKLRKVEGEADIYVVSNRKPNTSFHECAPQRAGSRAETCRIKSGSATIWYVGVLSKENSSYDLKVESKGFTGQPVSPYEIGAR